MQVKIKDIRIGKRFRRNTGDVTALAASIAELGLLHPVVLNSNHELVVGMRRIEAAKSLGWDSIPATVARTLDEAVAAIKAERDENALRLDFVPSEAVAIGEVIEKMERKEAKQRQAEAGPKEGKGAKPSACGKLPQALKGKSRDKIGSAVGMSGRTYEKAKAVIESGDKKLIEEMDRTKRVNGVHKKLVRKVKADALRAEPIPLPTGKHRVIVIDPPWKYDARADDAAHRASNPYPSMSIAEITKIPVGDFAERDAVLWLWVTNAHLPHAFAIVESWGFTYKTMLTWNKMKLGTGNWLRGQTEHCLLCVKGKPTVTLTNQTTIISEKSGRHSQKPEAFYALVEKMCPGSRLEMFQRQKRDGWNGWGDEA